MTQALSIRDIPLLSKATRERWPMSTQMRQQALDVCSKALTDVATDDRTKLRAVNTMARLDSINLRHEELFTPKMDLSLDLAGLSEDELRQRLSTLDQHLNSTLPIPDLTPETEIEHIKKMLAAEDPDGDRRQLTSTRSTTMANGEHSSRNDDLVRPRGKAATCRPF